MSTDPKDDAPPLDRDATRQDDALDLDPLDPDLDVSDPKVVSRLAAQWTRNHKRLILALIDSEESNGYEPVRSLIGPPKFAVQNAPATDKDFEHAKSLLTEIHHILKRMRRRELDWLVEADRVIHGVPADNEKNPRYVHYLGMFREHALFYHRAPKFAAETIRDTGRTLQSHDPKLANVKSEFVAKVIGEIDWQTDGGSGNTGWIHAAARIAVKVGAFGSDKRGETENDRIKKLRQSFATAWSNRPDKDE